MQYRTLGKTHLRLSAIGLGSWALGGGTDWGPTSFTDVQNTVAAALDAGINVIDTAPIYAQSEELLGRVLAGHRHQVLLSTKCGLVKNGSWTDHDLSPTTLVHQLETSLTRLKTDVIDIYWIHYLDPKIPWQEVVQTLSRLKQQGKIREIGVCNVPPDTLSQMAATGLISCVQDQLSLLHPTHGSTLLTSCQTHSLGFVAYGPLAGGILSGKYKREPNLRRADARNYFYKCYRAEAFNQAQKIVSILQQAAQALSVTPAQVALAWVLHQAGVTCALSGARQADQITQNAYAAELILPQDILCTLTK